MHFLEKSCLLSVCCLITESLQQLSKVTALLLGNAVTSGRDLFEGQGMNVSSEEQLLETLQPECKCDCHPSIYKLAYFYSYAGWFSLIT